MRLAEINDKVSVLKSRLESLNKQIRDVKAEYEQLKYQKYQVELGYFRKWLQIEQIIDVTGFMFCTGVETTKGKVDARILGHRPKPPHFRAGEQIQVLKVNQKSIAVKVIKGLYQDKTFRVEIDSFYQYLMENVTMHQTFQKWLIRTESLDELEILD